MKRFLIIPFITLFFIILFISKPNNSYAAGCTYSGPNPAKNGDSFSISYTGFAAGEQIGVWDRLAGTLKQDLGKTQDSTSTPQTLNSAFSLSSGGYSVMIQTRFPIVNFKCADVDISSSVGGTGGPGSDVIGSIQAPGSVLPPPANPTNFVAGFFRAIITFLIVAAFVIDLIWMILAGIKIITAGGDPKTLSSGYSQVLWGILGLVIVMGSYAIVKLVEIFFNVCVVSCFTLPSL